MNAQEALLYMQEELRVMRTTVEALESLREENRSLRMFIRNNRYRPAVAASSDDICMWCGRTWLERCTDDCKLANL